MAGRSRVLRLYRRLLGLQLRPQLVVANPRLPQAHKVQPTQRHCLKGQAQAIGTVDAV